MTDIDDKRADEEADAIFNQVKGTAPDVNFVHKLATEIHRAKRIIDYDVALTCASTLISNSIPKVVLSTAIGTLPLNEMNIIVGASGIGKTLPFRIVQDIITNIGVLFPGRYTVEGVERWFARRQPVENPITHEMEETGPFVNAPYCTIVTDEISQSFKEARKDYMSGSIELLSQLYDGRLKGTALSSGAREPQYPLYVNMLGATVPEFIPDLPKFVFEQGMAGRIYWLFIEPKYKLPDFDINNDFVYKKASENLKKYTIVLQKLFDINIYLNEKGKELPMRISSGASNVWKKYHDKTYNEWRNNYKNKPYDYDWQYKRRLHELALKKAGIFAIGRSIELVLETKNFSDIRVSDEDMEMAVEWVEKSEKYLRKIIKINQTGIVYSLTTRQALDNIYCVDNLVRHLLQAQNNMLNTKQLWELSRISDYKTFIKYLDKGRKESPYKIRKVDKKIEIKTNTERNRLKALPGLKTRIWTISDIFREPNYGN